MLDIRLESQFRSGTHYMLSSLAMMYGLRPMIIGPKGVFRAVNGQRLKQGLGDIEPEFVAGENDGCVFSYHFYHALESSSRLAESKTIYLIGYPFDSYLSLSLVYGSTRYTVAPSKSNNMYNNFIMEVNSSAFEQCSAYFDINIRWLEMLAQDDKAFVIRYEDLYCDILNVKNKLKQRIGRFNGDFLPLKYDFSRTYWSDEYLKRMDIGAFKSIYDNFFNVLNVFYPEKIRSLVEIRKL